MTPIPALRREIVSRYGTPVYVYDLDLVVAAQRALLAALPAGFEVFYAVKANPHPDIMRALGQGDPAGCGAEISSTGELAAVMAAGHPPQRCLYTGPGKTAAELGCALRAGVRLFSAESLTDLLRIGAAARARGVVADCLLRVNNDTGGAAAGVRMAGGPSQFGIDATALPDLVPALRSVPGTRIIGLHFFATSNVREEAGLIAEFDRTIATAAWLGRELGLPVRLLDIGGGFGAPYARPGGRPRYQCLRDALAATLDRHFPDWRAGRPRLACESGRHLVASSGTLLCRVQDVKVSRGRTFVVLDAGTNVLGGMSGLGRLLPVQALPSVVAEERDERADGGEQAEEAERADQTERTEQTEQMVEVDVVGPLCSPGDVLARQVRFPALSAGDTVAIPNCGAYGPTASLLAFLGRTAPVEVTVCGGQVMSASRLAVHRSVVDARSASSAEEAVPEPPCRG